VKRTVLAIPFYTTTGALRMAALREEEFSMCVLFAGCMEN